MTDTTSAALCRLTVRAPARTVDLAVPVDVPVADLLPTLVGYGGEELEEAGTEHEGWTLQRLGGPRLDPESTLAVLGLRDGEILYLRPRADALPEVDLDDLVDGISTAMRDRPHGWSPAVGRRLLYGLGATTLALGLIVLAQPGPAVRLRAVAAAATGLLLIAGAGSASRAVGDAAAGSVLGLAATGYFALAGWLLPGGAAAGGSAPLAASAATAGAAVLALAAVGTYPALFLGVAVTAAAGALGAVLLLSGLTVREAAGVVSVTVVLFGGFVPSLSFRLAGMRMPPLPTNAQQLQEGIDPYPPDAVRARSVQADGWMTAFYGAIGLICLPCLAGLLAHPTASGVWTAVALSALLLLHSRGLGNVWQRLALTAAGAFGAALLLYGPARGVPSTGTRLLLCAALLALAAALMIASWTVPGRRLVPYWGRAAELLHSLAVIGLIPLMLWTAGLYGLLRGLNG
ncbi:type VII secretion integral membrane protein EccD [Streptomyces sp. NBC_00328]|uniref:type VII secretion integral membrane protein EccD n=1 Tax=Streptomyces sp. NBC_00328 TaxID=2903646 RepID=UPI002E2C8345|nr:type VII secretion integral membrane protein EccD [Streptomyces sp. NBC_00328]